MMTIEEKAKRYEEAIERARAKYAMKDQPIHQDLVDIFHELAESEDEKIRKEIINYFKCQSRDEPSRKDTHNRWIAWLEKQGEQKSCMIQWKGDNLKEVIDFTGKDKNFEKWFKSFEEYEKYVHEHNDIFKLFNEDGSHYEVPVGAWIVKTPDGYNVASKAVLKQKSAEWSEECCINQLIVFCENCMVQDTNAKRCANFLKSLKERVLPQNIAHYNPYKEVVESIAEMCKHYDNMDVGSMQDFYDNVKVKCKDAKEYDSLFSQNRWKPSESDILLLERIANGKSNPQDFQASLCCLIEQLKKLRGEQV